MQPRQLAELRTERLIATGRLTLAALVLLAIWIDPDEPSRLPPLGYAVAALYVGYAALLSALSWAPGSQLVRWRLVTHVTDLLTYSAIIFFTNGATSPFFVFLVFALVAAALRWQWYGVYATAAAALVAYVSIALANSHPGEQGGTVLTIVIRSTYLSVFAALLGFLGDHYRRLQRDIDALADWPAELSSDPATLRRQLIERIATVLSVNDVALARWERESTCVALTRRRDGDVRELRLGASSAAALVAAELADRGFLSSDGSAATATVLYLPDGGGLARWRGAAISSLVSDELPSGPLLSVTLDGQHAAGRLFAGGRRFSYDDLVLAQLLARQIVPQLERVEEVLRERREAALVERMRLAQDLHDGVIQSLTGASLRLQSADRLLERRPQQARQLLSEVDELLVSEQRELRWFLTEQRSSAAWMDRLRQLVDHMARNWGMAVWMQGDADASLTGELGHEVYRIVQEALVNAARHGGAQTASVQLRSADEHLELLVEDDGHGFPFRGHFDDAALREQRLGPVSIKQRVGALGGRLAITSGERGARLEVRLPLVSTVS